MRLMLLGDADDARGFRLAGIDTTLCRTREDIEHALAKLLDEPDRRTGVVLVSEQVYQLAPRELDALRDRARWPILVVLPEGDESKGSGR